jgi:hypothetical protein
MTSTDAGYPRKSIFANGAMIFSSAEARRYPTGRYFTSDICESIAVV